MTLDSNRINNFILQHTIVEDHFVTERSPLHFDLISFRVERFFEVFIGNSSGLDVLDLLKNSL
jgi:hypothetical protein